MRSGRRHARVSYFFGTEESTWGAEGLSGKALSFSGNRRGRKGAGRMKMYGVLVGGESKCEGCPSIRKGGVVAIIRVGTGVMRVSGTGVRDGKWGRSPNVCLL